MTRKILCLFVIALTVAGAALAADFPSYYPKDGFQRTGRIDAVYADESRVVIDDITYQLADSVIVHSLSSYSVSKARLQQGTIVGYKVGGGRKITEFWLLPDDYDVNRRR